jgi:hypothetical protein
MKKEGTQTENNIDIDIKKLPVHQYTKKYLYSLVLLMIRESHLIIDLHKDCQPLRNKQSLRVVVKSLKLKEVKH